MFNNVERVPLFVLWPLRLACGYFLAATGLGKILSGWLTNPLFAVRLGEWRHAEHPGRLSVLLDPILAHMQHHAQIYSTLTAAGELILGAALLCGLFARYAALLGLLFCLLPLVAAPSSGGADLVVCAALLSLGLCASGRTLGVDGLWPRLRGSAAPGV